MEGGEERTQGQPLQTLRGWIEEEALSKETQKRQTQSRREAKNVAATEAKKEECFERQGGDTKLEVLIRAI